MEQAGLVTTEKVGRVRNGKLGPRRLGMGETFEQLDELLVTLVTPAASASSASGAS